MSDASWDEVEKELKLIGCLIRRLPAEERKNAACRIACEVVIWGGDTFYEQIGILEEAKFQFREMAEGVMNEEDEE